VASHRTGDSRVQDAYSLRCTPQVHGAALDTIAHARTIAAASSTPHRQPDDPAGRPGRVVRQLPRRARWRSCATSSAIAISELGGDRRAPHDRLLDAGRSTRAAAVPQPTDAGVNWRVHDRPLHAGPRWRLECQRPGGAGGHAVAADERDAGDQRLQRLGGGAQTAAQRSPNLRRVLAVELVCARPGSTCRRTAQALAGHRGRARRHPRRDRQPRIGPLLSHDLGTCGGSMLADGSVLTAVETAVGALE
jgi:histidine ammonia-lyase